MRDALRASADTRPRYGISSRWLPSAFKRGLLRRRTPHRGQKRTPAHEPGDAQGDVRRSTEISVGRSRGIRIRRAADDPLRMAAGDLFCRGPGVPARTSSLVCGQGHSAPLMAALWRGTRHQPRVEPARLEVLRELASGYRMAVWGSSWSGCRRRSALS